MKTIFLSVAASLTLLALGMFIINKKQTTQFQETSRSIVVGSKNFTESIALAHMIADIIEENTDIRVIRKVNLGGTNIAWQALLKNDIQIYPEYVSTVVLNTYNQKPQPNETIFEQAQDLLLQDDIKFVTRFGVNNGYRLAVTRDLASRHNLRTISDLTQIANQLDCGSDFEFMDRPDGYRALVNTYNIKFRSLKGMDHGIVYRSILDNKLDVVVGYNTDSQMFLYDLVTLDDDKQFCGCYDAATLVRKDALENYPEIGAALNTLQGQVSDEEMRQINADIDYQGYKAKEVINNFLQQKGLVKRCHG